MTNNQRDLITDNIKVIYKSLSDNKISDEDDVGDALLFICYHIDDYDENKSNFSTFVYMLIKYMIKQKQQFKTYDKRKLNYMNMYSLEYVSEDGSTLKEKIIEPTNIQNDIEINNILNHCKSKLTDKELITFNNMLEGQSQTTIADEIGCTRQNVSYISQRLKEKLKEELYECK